MVDTTTRNIAGVTLYRWPGARGNDLRGRCGRPPRLRNLSTLSNGQRAWLLSTPSGLSCEVGCSSVARICERSGRSLRAKAS